MGEKTQCRMVQLFNGAASTRPRAPCPPQESYVSCHIPNIYKYSTWARFSSNSAIHQFDRGHTPGNREDRHCSPEKTAPKTKGTKRCAHQSATRLTSALAGRPNLYTDTTRRGDTAGGGEAVFATEPPPAREQQLPSKQIENFGGGYLPCLHSKIYFLRRR